MKWLNSIQMQTFNASKWVLSLHYLRGNSLILARAYLCFCSKTSSQTSHIAAIPLSIGPGGVTKSVTKSEMCDEVFVTRHSWGTVSFRKDRFLYEISRLEDWLFGCPEISTRSIFCLSPCCYVEWWDTPAAPKLRLRLRLLAKAPALPLELCKKQLTAQVYVRIIRYIHSSGHDAYITSKPILRLQ